ncbi:SDR family NAD(P)-dependent oxidoreductase [Burkholderia guangdongensis]|uniref:SDR family NAD(P)-dependent oxidoreductase n=1 Tax=Burkholderia guangdongensis TaxID=1792500 RepID=UPI0015CDEFAA|nr:SDR family NAD(P)-dependent oxidoreductase [Burkholderia guangdongensis]
MRFNDKVAIVTGAASGIGRASAQRLYREGASVALIDRDAQALADVAGTMDAARVWHRGVDVANEDDVAACVDEIERRFGAIDVLCNNAGIAGGDYSIIAETQTDVWTKIIAVNLMGVVHFTKWVSRGMIERQRGAIVNTASVAGVRSGAGGNAYSASKAAVINLTMTSACDLGQWGIRVNAVCPGLIETGMTAPVFARAKALGKEDKLGSRCELRRAGRPEEVAAAIAFLASDDASYITGQALPVDGGNTASLNLPGMKV